MTQNHGKTLCYCIAPDVFASFLYALIICDNYTKHSAKWAIKLDNIEAICALRKSLRINSLKFMGNLKVSEFASKLLCRQIT